MAPARGTAIAGYLCLLLCVLGAAVGVRIDAVQKDHLQRGTSDTFLKDIDPYGILTSPDPFALPSLDPYSFAYNPSQWPGPLLMASTLPSSSPLATFRKSQIISDKQKLSSQISTERGLNMQRKDVIRRLEDRIAQLNDYLGKAKDQVKQSDSWLADADKTLKVLDKRYQLVDLEAQLSDLKVQRELAQNHENQINEMAKVKTTMKNSYDERIKSLDSEVQKITKEIEGLGAGGSGGSGASGASGASGGGAASAAAAPAAGASASAAPAAAEAAPPASSGGEEA